MTFAMIYQYEIIIDFIDFNIDKICFANTGEILGNSISYQYSHNILPILVEYNFGSIDRFY